MEPLGHLLHQRASSYVFKRDGGQKLTDSRNTPRPLPQNALPSRPRSRVFSRAEYPLTSAKVPRARAPTRPSSCRALVRPVAAASISTNARTVSPYLTRSGTEKQAGRSTLLYSATSRCSSREPFSCGGLKRLIHVYRMYALETFNAVILGVSTLYRWTRRDFLEHHLTLVVVGALMLLQCDAPHSVVEDRAERFRRLRVPR